MFSALMSCLVWSECVWVNVHEIAEMSVILLNDPAQSSPSYPEREAV